MLSLLHMLSTDLTVGEETCHAILAGWRPVLMHVSCGRRKGFTGGFERWGCSEAIRFYPEGFDFFLNLLLTYLPPVPMDNFSGLDLNSPLKLRSTKTPSPRKFSGICLCRFRFFAPQPTLFCDQGRQDRWNVSVKNISTIYPCRYVIFRKRLGCVSKWGVSQNGVNSQ